MFKQKGQVPIIIILILVAIIGGYLIFYGKFGINQKQTPLSQSSALLICGDNITDSRDGQTYPTVKIGSQCWMAKNMNIGTMIGSKLADNFTSQLQTNNNVIEKYCYGYVQQENADQKLTGTANCNSDGGLYTWDEAMQYLTSEGAQGICPNGWHIPTDNELYILEKYLASGNCSPSTTKVYDCVPAGTSLTSGGNSGFNAPLAGYRFGSDGLFIHRGLDTNLWSSSVQNSSSAWIRNLWSGVGGVLRANYFKQGGISVRCLKN